MIQTTQEFDQLRQSATTLEIPADLTRWLPHELSNWMTEVEFDESVPPEDAHRARQAVTYSLGIDPSDGSGDQG